MARFKSPITAPGYRKGVPNPNKGKRYPGETYTRPEILAMQSHCNKGASGRRDYCLLTFLHRTGVRIGEAVGTQIHDLDFDRKLIRVRGTKTKRADRVVGMHPALEKDLLDWLKRRTEIGAPGGFVFCCVSRWELGNQVKPTQVRQKLKLLAKYAGITKRLHCPTKGLDPMTEAMYEVPQHVLHELRELRKIGDTLQSAASRLGDHIERGDKALPPYEVAMACHEVRDCVEKWTEIRKASR